MPRRFDHIDIWGAWFSGDAERRAALELVATADASAMRRMVGCANPETKAKAAKRPRKTREKPPPLFAKR